MPTVTPENMPTVHKSERRLAIKTTFPDPDFLACFPACVLWLRLGYTHSAALTDSRDPSPIPHFLSLLILLALQLWLVSGSFCFVGQALRTICQRHNALHFGRFGRKQTSIEHTTANSCSSVGLHPILLHLLHPGTLGQAAICTLQRRGEHVEWALWFTAFCWSLLKREWKMQSHILLGPIVLYTLYLL